MGQLILGIELVLLSAQIGKLLLSAFQEQSNTCPYVKCKECPLANSSQ
jgi:hypothetical protein